MMDNRELNSIFFTAMHQVNNLIIAGKYTRQDNYFVVEYHLKKYHNELTLKDVFAIIEKIRNDNIHVVLDDEHLVFYLPIDRQFIE
jgi:hypothetical protein